MFRKSSPEIKRILYATDLHGSTLVFKKLLNAAKINKASLVIMGGDISGKIFFPIVQSGKNIYEVDYYGRKVTLNSESELNQFSTRLEKEGNYYKVVTKDEFSELIADEKKMNLIFQSLIIERLKQWVDLATQTLRDINVPLLISGGNDDDQIVVDSIINNEIVKNVDNKVYLEFQPFSIINIGFSNLTPFETPREKSEEEIGKLIDNLSEPYAKDPSHLIFNIHVPPYGSTLDLAPKLVKNESGELEMVLNGGQPELIHTGSKSVMDSILKYKPALGLFGHIHEARAAEKIGDTLCINPGSSYGDGTLNYALINIREGKILSYQLMMG
ncbi:MAG: metallophosphoesterase [Caldisphaera sp.]|jgi:Icc-related predicted phosphoesterase